MKKRPRKRPRNTNERINIIRREWYYLFYIVYQFFFLLRVSFKYKENPFEYEEKTDKKNTKKMKTKSQEKDI